MSPFRYRDDRSSSTTTVLGILAGAVAGFAVGMIVAQRVGGIDGLTSRLRRRRGVTETAALHEAHGVAEEEEEDFSEFEEDELEAGEYDETLEEQVLGAFQNDPILSRRAIDIGAISDGTIELAGWVDNDAEAERAVTIARGIPGVETVINRIVLGEEERRFDDAARRVREGDASLTEAQWEGQRIGTGRRRQGTSSEPDRHEDPKVDLENRWLSRESAIKDSADEATIPVGERERGVRRHVTRGDRTGGAPITPTGVPKADHVANPRPGSE